MSRGPEIGKSGFRDFGETRMGTANIFSAARFRHRPSPYWEGFRPNTGSGPGPDFVGDPPAGRPISRRSENLRFLQKTPKTPESRISRFRRKFVERGQRLLGGAFRVSPSDVSQEGFGQISHSGSGIRRFGRTFKGADFGGNLLTFRPISGRPADMRFSRKALGNQENAGTRIPRIRDNNSASPSVAPPEVSAQNGVRT